LDDDPTPTVGFRVTAASGPEASSATLQVDLSAASGQTATVYYDVSGGTATNRVDYTLEPGTLTFRPGETTKTLTIPLVNDHLREGDETIEVSPSAPPGATLGPNTVPTSTINDDDLAPTVAFASASGSGPETLAHPSVPVTLSAAAGQAVAVHYA